MALLSTQVLPDNTLEEFRIEFNKLVTDVSGLSLGNTFDTQIIFEGTTDDTFETAISVTDPTADRSIVFPNASGNVLLDSTNIALGDNIEIQFGDGTDLKIFHNGSNSIIRDNGTGALFLEGSTVSIRDEASSETMADFVSDGAVSLYYDNSAVLATASGGVSVTGTLTTSGILKTDDTTDATSTTDGSLQTDGGLSVVKDIVVGDDIRMLSNSAQIAFGVSAEINMTHVQNTGLTITHNQAGNGAPMILQLKSEEDAIIADEVIASLEFAAGDSDGTDGATVSAGIHAIAEGTFSASANATKLVFTTGVSETAAASATAKMTLSSAGLLTIADDFIIKDAGTIGSASDTDAISISSGGVVNISATTANTSASDGALTVAGGLGVAADASIGDDLRLISDSAVLSFGADSDTTLTHTDGSGLTLNSTNKLMFNDASQFIQGASATVLDIAATDEIELTATLIDVVGNLAGSGTGTFGGILKTDDTTEATSTTDGSLQTDGGLSVAKDIVAGNDVKLLSDSAVLSFGADSEVTLTHVADQGLTLKNTNTGDDKPIILTLQTGETDMAADEVLGEIRFQAPDEGTGTDAILVAAAISARSEGDFSSSSNATKLSFQTGASEAASEKMILASDGDLSLLTDTVALKFGADSEVSLNHVHNVGLHLIGTTATNSYTELKLTDGNAGYAWQVRSDAAQSISTGSFVLNDVDTGSFPVVINEGNATNTLVVTSSKVGIGNTAPATKLDVAGNIRFSAGDPVLEFNSGGPQIYVTASNTLQFATGGGIGSATERMRIDSGGNVSIGESSTTARLNAYKASNVYAELGTATNGHFFSAQSDDNTDAFEIFQQHGSNTTRMSFIVNDNRTGSKSAAFSVRGDGAVAVAGALSKGSGSFKIDHPLESKKDTHYLAHSFVEGPQADNIYRGKVNLVNGTSTVNVDTVANLTEGTFVALNRDIQCFTTNETGWTAVKGSVSGNVLTINAQDNTCTDTISWLVIGERQDPHMYEVDWTDKNGKVITEPLKEES